MRQREKPSTQALAIYTVIGEEQKKKKKNEGKKIHWKHVPNPDALDHLVASYKPHRHRWAYSEIPHPQEGSLNKYNYLFINFFRRIPIPVIAGLLSINSKERDKKERIR